MTLPSERILVIKLGALGDFVQATGPFAAIRAHHPEARITLLTTRPYADLADRLGLFNAIWIDDKPKLLQVGKWLDLRRILRGGKFTRVYDLQTSDRSGFYRRLLGSGPEWSGIAPGCSHPHANPKRDLMHTIERQAEQLHMAGLDTVPPPSLANVEGQGPAYFEIEAPFALLVPGGAPHRPEKRWPAGRFAELGTRLSEKGITPVLLGTPAEADALEKIQALCPAARNLAGRTELPDIVSLAREATCAVGNDTGPMHLIAVAGCRCVVLYSHESDPALCAQRGPDVTILRKESLETLSAAEAAETLNIP